MLCRLQHMFMKQQGRILSGMHHDIKRRLLSAVVQENVTATIVSAGPTPTPQSSASKPVRRSWWGSTVQMLCLTAMLVLVPLNDMSTGIVPVVESPPEEPLLTVSAVQEAQTPRAPEGHMATALQVAMLAPGVDFPVALLETSGPMVETGSLPEPTYPAPVPLDPAVIALEVRKIVLDPGHGGKDLGTATPSGLSEKEITLDIALRLRPLLEQAGYEVVMTRTKDETVSLRQRTALANTHQGDVFVSIHINWLDRSPARGIETYYLGPTEDPTTLQLTAQENRETGYSLADFRRLLDHIYLSVKRDESRRLAEMLQHTMVMALHPKNPALGNRGVKTAPFAVLMGTEMPAILAEVACLSHTEEAQLLATPQYRQDIAQALLQGIRAYAHALNRSPKLSQERKLTHE